MVFAMFIILYFLFPIFQYLLCSSQQKDFFGVLISALAYLYNSSYASLYDGDHMVLGQALCFGLACCFHSLLSKYSCKQLVLCGVIWSPCIICTHKVVTVFFRYFYNALCWCFYQILKKVSAWHPLIHECSILFSKTKLPYFYPSCTISYYSCARSNSVCLAS